jgi:hypothetical protein
MKLQRAELKLGWKYSAIAFMIAATSVSPEIYRLISSQEFVKSHSKNVANLLSQEGEKLPLEHPATINHPSNYVAGIEHDPDDKG